MYGHTNTHLFLIECYVRNDLVKSVVAFLATKLHYNNVRGIGLMEVVSNYSG